MTDTPEFSTIDEYIAMFPKDVQVILQKIRTTIKEVTPEAAETISYKLPTFKLGGKPLVYFGAWQHHVGFYATPSGNAVFQKELAAYEGAKGSVKFPLDQPMPYDLIARITKYRMQEIQKQSGTGD